MKFSLAFFIISRQNKDRRSVKMTQYEELLEKIKTNDLVKYLNLADNAIAIYNKDARLIFANKIWCQDFNIANPADAIGLRVDQIMRQFHIELTYM